ncbi:MAG: cupin domain-containing protein [Solirubrobacterales bacterium]
MSDGDHTIINLREVEDSAPKFGFADSQEARFAREALGCEQVGLSLQRVKPDQRQSFGHRHEQDEEVYVILSGIGRVLLDEDALEVRPMDAVRVAPGVTRAFEAGRDGLELIAFGTHRKDDAEVVPGFGDD